MGRSFLTTIDHTWGTFALAKKSLLRLPDLRRGPVRSVFLRQVYFTGIEAVGRVSLIAALTGIVIVTQISSFLGVNTELTGRILAWTVVRELGPLFAAIIIITRSGTAVAAELGSMSVNGEVRYLAAMGIDPHAYLIMPRIAGMVVSLFALTVFFQVVATFGGLGLSSLIMPIPFLAQAKNIYAHIGISGILASLIKSFVFGLVVAAGSCYYGLQVRLSITEIPQMAALAVTQGLTLVVIINGVITVFFFV